MPRESDSWVIYRMTIHNKTEGVLAVCAQRDWEAMERSRPGYHKLVQDHIATETEAELMARGTSGDRVKR